MGYDPNGTWDWNKFWAIFGAVAVVIAVTAATVLTAGMFAVALGATAAVTAAVMAGAAIGGVTLGALNIASQATSIGVENIDPLSVAQATFTGAAIGAVVAGSLAASVGAGAGALALAGGGTVNSGAALAKVAALGVIVLFAKDPFIKNLEHGMSDYQKEMFQREIEDWKYSEGRGGADNLSKEILKEIAKMIRQMFK